MIPAINTVQEVMGQDMVKAAVQKLGFIPLIPSFYGSSPQTPADLTLFCPHCFNEIKIKNTPATVHSSEDGSGYGDKWGWEVQGNGKRYFYTDLFHCHLCRRVHKLEFNNGKNYFVSYVEEENETGVILNNV